MLFRAGVGDQVVGLAAERLAELFEMGILYGFAGAVFHAQQDGIRYAGAARQPGAGVAFSFKQFLQTDFDHGYYLQMVLCPV